MQHDYQPQLATDLTHSSLSAGVSTGDGRIDVNLEEVDLSRDSLSEEGDADEEDSDEWCNVVCGSVKGRLCWEKLGDGRSKCIRWGNENEWVTPIEFEREGGKGRARKWKHSIRVVGGDILGKALILRQKLIDQAVLTPVQRQDTPNFCAVRGVPEAEQGLGSLNPEYEDGPADTEPSLQEETANLSGNSTGSEPSDSTSLMDDRPASPVSPQLSKTVNGPSGHKSSLREVETECTEVREGRGKLGGELQNVEAVPHSTCTDDLQTSVINKGHGEDASKGV